MVSLFLFLLLFIPAIILLVILYFTGILFLIPARIFQKAHDKMNKDIPVEYEIINDEEKNDDKKEE